MSAPFLFIAKHFRLSRNPVPLDKIEEAKPVGFDGVRAWGDQYSKDFQEDIINSVHQERECDFPVKPDGSCSYDILAITGGGAHGAFGAGFLCGWTESGKRPPFKLVTGISTGALLATYAFLGSEYDKELKGIFTHVKNDNIFRVRHFFSWLWRESFATTKPLQKIIAKYGDESALQAIAKAHRQGRRLYVGTTNMDAQRLMVWDIGAVATSGYPGALQLYQKIMLASASIPVAFPPVFFDVEVDGQVYDEMHFDGGTITDVFICGYMLDLVSARKKINERKTTSKLSISAYIIRNGKLKPSPQAVHRNLRKITRRTILTCYKAHGWDHLNHIYDTIQQNHFDFNYIGIPQEFEFSDKQSFNQEEMTRLFNYGKQMGKAGDLWHKMPVGLENNNH